MSDSLLDSMLDPLAPSDLVDAVRARIAAAESAGVALDDGNVVDLLADQLPTVPLADLRAALVAAGLAARFPVASRLPAVGSLATSLERLELELERGPGRFVAVAPSESLLLDGRRRFVVLDAETREPVSWSTFADAAFGNGPGAVVDGPADRAARAGSALARSAFAAIERDALELGRGAPLGALELANAIAARCRQVLEVLEAPGDVAAELGRDDDDALDALLDERLPNRERLEVLARDAGAFERAIARRARALAAAPERTVDGAFAAILEGVALYRERVRLRLRDRLAPPARELGR